jgi:probable non-F420 flavinoid oxidoreductase
MFKIGFHASHELYPPGELLRMVQAAERAGFGAAMCSDHFHPWTERQGQSGFAWAWLGAAMHATRLPFGVVCAPGQRYHPAIIAQAAATLAEMFPGRFWVALGTGQNLNEHITGDVWPTPDIRQDMLEEAVEVIRLLHQGGEQSHYGRFFTVHDARVYNLPDEPVPIYFAAAGDEAARLAGRKADGMICTSPEPETVKAFEGAGGAGKPKYGELTVCWAETEDKAVRTAHEFWPNAALSGQFKNELPRPLYLEQAAKSVRPEDVAKKVTCGPDPGKHLEAIEKFVKAGFENVYVHQVGPDQTGFMRFYAREILPNVKELAA